VYHVESVLDNLALGKILDIELKVVSMGGVAFCAEPAELFDSTCSQIWAYLGYATLAKRIKYSCGASQSQMVMGAFQKGFAWSGGCCCGFPESLL